MKTQSGRKVKVARLSPTQIKRFKDLARTIDAEEQEDITARGREIFRRHSLARQMVEKLKAKRVAQGISLSELANRTGIAKSNLSRLENSERSSPTLDTLHRYAQALGMTMRVELN
jgi:DNA-binding Xre family transcriptional regulator